jgi:hypothetical protein
MRIQDIYTENIKENLENLNKLIQANKSKLK